MENKRKIIKLECLKCGGLFITDYRAKHDRQQHDGKRVAVKHFGAPENLSEALKYLHIYNTIFTIFTNCKLA
jgi:hypothetical protein